jgi:hypothetical protein
MLFRRKNPALSRQQALAVKPVRLVMAEVNELDDGSGKLKVPLRQTRWTGWFFRSPPEATKTFEFDSLGILVWKSCDGRTSVQQIIRRLAKEYKLNLREAEVPTIKFLQMLVKKGLVGMQVPEGTQKQGV